MSGNSLPPAFTGPPSVLVPVSASSSSASSTPSSSLSSSLFSSGTALLAGAALAAAGVCAFYIFRHSSSSSQAKKKKKSSVKKVSPAKPRVVLQEPVETEEQKQRRLKAEQDAAEAKAQGERALRELQERIAKEERKRELQRQFDEEQARRRQVEAEEKAKRDEVARREKERLAALALKRQKQAEERTAREAEEKRQREAEEALLREREEAARKEREAEEERARLQREADAAAAAASGVGASAEVETKAETLGVVSVTTDAAAIKDDQLAQGESGGLASSMDLSDAPVSLSKSDLRSDGHQESDAAAGSAEAASGGDRIPLGLSSELSADRSHVLVSPVSHPQPQTHNNLLSTSDHLRLEQSFLRDADDSAILEAQQRSAAEEDREQQRSGRFSPPSSLLYDSTASASLGAASPAAPITSDAPASTATATAASASDSSTDSSNGSSDPTTDTSNNAPAVPSDSAAALIDSVVSTKSASHSRGNHRDSYFLKEDLADLSPLSPDSPSASSSSSSTLLPRPNGHHGAGTMGSGIFGSLHQPPSTEMHVSNIDHNIDSQFFATPIASSSNKEDTIFVAAASPDSSQLNTPVAEASADLHPESGQPLTNGNHEPTPAQVPANGVPLSHSIDDFPHLAPAASDGPVAKAPSAPVVVAQNFWSANPLKRESSSSDAASAALPQ